MKVKWLERSLIETPFYYTLCTTEKQYQLEMKKFGISDTGKVQGKNASTNFFSNQEGETVAIVCMFDRPKTLAQAHALIAHEAVHLWQELRTQMGEDAPSKEFEAYCMQRLCQELFFEYKRQTK